MSVTRVYPFLRHFAIMTKLLRFANCEPTIVLFF